MQQPLKLRVAVTGGSGMIGRALVDSFRGEGHEVVSLSRTAGEKTLVWDPDEKVFDPEPLEGFDAVVHLAGENIAQRWTGAARDRIYTSRMRSTKVLVDGLSKLSSPPGTLLSASGINFYPPTKMGARLDESTEHGEGFLSRVCHHWEIEARRAGEMGIRVCLLRTAVVLSPEGGALAKLLPVFRAGLGGPVAPGDQPFPWISINDYVGAVRHLLCESTLAGPVNLAAPDRVTNRQFSKALANALGRPCCLKVPRSAVRLAFGAMGKETLTEGVDAVPRALQEDGYSFADGKLVEALDRLLDR